MTLSSQETHPEMRREEQAAERASGLEPLLQPRLPLPYLENKSESRSVTTDSMRPHGLHSPWNSPGQNTGVGSLSLLQGIFPAQGLNSGLPYCRQILYQLIHKGSPSYLELKAITPCGRGGHTSCLPLGDGGEGALWSPPTAREDPTDHTPQEQLGATASQGGYTCDGGLPSCRRPWGKDSTTRGPQRERGHQSPGREGGGARMATMLTPCPDYISPYPLPAERIKDPLGGGRGWLKAAHKAQTHAGGEKGGGQPPSPFPKSEIICSLSPPLLLEQGSPKSRLWTSISYKISGSIRLEIKCTVNVMHLHHPQTTPQPQSVENCLP